MPLLIHLLLNSLFGSGMVPHQCDIRPGLAPVQPSLKSRCFSEAILWMCPEMFYDSNSVILRAAKASLDSSCPWKTCSSCFADFCSDAVSMLKDGTAFLHTSNYKLGHLIWFGKQLLGFFFSPPLSFFLFNVNWKANCLQLSCWLLRQNIPTEVSSFVCTSCLM